MLKHQVKLAGSLLNRKFFAARKQYFFFHPTRFHQRDAFSSAFSCQNPNAVRTYMSFRSSTQKTPKTVQKIPRFLDIEQINGIFFIQMSPFFCGVFVGQKSSRSKKDPRKSSINKTFPAQIENMQRKNFPTSTLNTTSSMGFFKRLVGGVKVRPDSTPETSPQRMNQICGYRVSSKNITRPVLGKPPCAWLFLYYMGFHR